MCSDFYIKPLPGNVGGVFSIFFKHRSIVRKRCIVCLEVGLLDYFRVEYLRRLDSKKSMKNSAYAELDRIIFSYYLAYADEPKALSYKDTFGRIHNLQFNRHDFIEYDPVKGEYYYDDGYLFSVDTSKSVEQQREYIWQKNLENLRSGTLGNPESTETLLRYWQCQERAHYPFARDNVEYFSALLQRENVASKPTDKPLDSPKKPEPLPTEKDAEQYIPAPAKDGE